MSSPCENIALHSESRKYITGGKTEGWSTQKTSHTISKTWTDVTGK